MDPSKSSSTSEPTDEEKKLNTDPTTETDDKPSDSMDSSSDAAEDKPAEDSGSSDSGSESDKPADADSSSDSSSDAADSASSDASASDAPASDAASSDAPAPMPPMGGDASGSDAGAPVGMMMGGGAAASAKPKKKGLVMALVAAGAILVLGGGASAAYFGYVVPNKPENVLKTALKNTFSGKAVTSVYGEGSFSVTDKSSDQTFTANFTTKANQQGALDMSVDLDAIVTKVTLDFRSVDGSSYYFKVGGLSGLPDLLAAGGEAEVAQTYGPLINTVNNQWFEITNSMLKSLGLDTSAKISDADMQKIAQVYEQHQFLAVKDKLASESIKGMDSYHYTVVLNKDELVGFIRGVNDANIQAFKGTKSSLTQVNKSLEDMKVDFNKYPLDVWIAKDKKVIDQIKFSASNSDVSASMRVTMFDFNKPVTVEKPANAKSLMELLTSIFGGTAASSQSQVFEELQSNGISL